MPDCMTNAGQSLQDPCIMRRVEDPPALFLTFGSLAVVRPASNKEVAIGISSRLQLSIVDVTLWAYNATKAETSLGCSVCSYQDVWNWWDVLWRLNSVLDQCPLYSALIVLGNFNAVTDTERASYKICVSPRGSGTSNENTCFLLNFARSRRLRIAGAWYQRPALHLWTWYSNAGGAVK